LYFFDFQDKWKSQSREKMGLFGAFPPEKQCLFCETTVQNGAFLTFLFSYFAIFATISQPRSNKNKPGFSLNHDSN
jgi:hypothetical protein